MLSLRSRAIRLSLLLPTTLTALVLGFAIGAGANAQTSEEPSFTITADIQEEDNLTGDVTARGNVSIAYPAAQIQGIATEARYIKAKRQVVLTGDVQLVQRGQSLQGQKVTCLIEEMQCTQD
ncbi:MAG: LptA/OstA family protein [Cyanobacteriota bacterium]